MIDSDSEVEYSGIYCHNSYSLYYQHFISAILRVANKIF